MFSRIKQKVAFKLAAIILLAVSMIGMVALFIMARDNTVRLTGYLNNSLSSVIHFSEFIYSKPLWGQDYSEIERLNGMILENDFIVAINIFDKASCISTSRQLPPVKGEKGQENQKIAVSSSKVPYRIPSGVSNIKKVSKDIRFNDKTVGRFELFYTDRHILEAVHHFNYRILAAYVISSLIVVCVVLFSILRIVKPIEELAGIARNLARSRDFSIKLNRKKQADEVGVLFNSFIDMVEQIKARKQERDDLQAELEERISNFRQLFESLQTAVDNEAYAYRMSPISREDDLVPSLNKMLETLEKADSVTKNQNWIKNGQAELSGIIGGEQSITKLAGKAVNFICTYSGAHVGTIFVLDEQAEEFYLVASYAFKYRKGLANRFKPGQGLGGQAVLEKKTIVFTDIPKDYIHIESSLGNVVPHLILVIPLIYEGEVKGVLELGSLTSFSDTKMEFLESVGDTLAIAINAAMFNDQLSRLLDQTKKQALELKSQQEELKASNEELEEQTQVLKESEEKLQAQQEELQASNEELEEKTEMLEAKKEEIEKKNTILQVKQQEIEEKAEQLTIETKYKSEFLANMSHELRTPLNSLLILANMLAENDEQNLTEDQIESATSIYRSGQNLLHLINDILDLSKIEANKIELSITGITIEELGQNFKTEFLHMAKEKHLEFVVTMAEGLPETITTDVHRLEQVIRNLVGNAMKFTEKGSITLDFSFPDPAVKLSNPTLSHETCMAISVIDTGEGIPEDKIKIIFEAFKQVDGSISRKHGGTGLGLSISKELCAILGGELKATSVYGRGSTFTVYIPIHFTGENGAPAPVAEPGPRPPAPPAGKIKPAPPPPQETREGPTLPSSVSQCPKTMLIIEDDRQFSTLLEDYFRKNGYEPLVAPDGETGIQYAIEKHPAAIILDIGLPGIDGWEVLAELKQNSFTRHIPVHIISGLDESEQGIKKGAVGYLTKPVSPDGLNLALEKIENILSDDVKNLLVIEDDKELQLSIMKLIGSNHVKATAANTGKEAMDLLKTGRFDCMILDIGLPDISGFKLLNMIKKDPDINMIPVIIYTGRDLTREETRELETYASSIVLKRAASMERLLDETALFLHQVETDMSKDQKQGLKKEREKHGSLKDKKVLVVDDDMRNAFALNKFLKSKGMAVMIANNGEKALEALEKEDTPDIVLMDIMMPVMDGYETMKQIRKQEKFKDLPILALTAKAMASDRDKCIECGANDYLSKPLDTDKLLTMLRVWLS